jgi:SAM-dependent methyltransferase
MAHPDQMEFFADVVSAFPTLFADSVIDIGSLDINGGPHTLLNAHRYVGVDVAEGPNVSLVSRGECVDLPDASFAVAMSSECFEHNPGWRETLRTMVRLVRPGGLIAFSCATIGRREHGTARSDGGFASPLTTALGQDYYANVAPEAVLDVIRPADFSAMHLIVNQRKADLYVVALRSGADSVALGVLAELGNVLRRRYASPSYRAHRLVRATLAVAGEQGLATARRRIPRFP